MHKSILVVAVQTAFELHRLYRLMVAAINRMQGIVAMAQDQYTIWFYQWECEEVWMIQRKENIQQSNMGETWSWNRHLWNDLLNQKPPLAFRHLIVHLLGKGNISVLHLYILLITIKFSCHQIEIGNVFYFEMWISRLFGSSSKSRIKVKRNDLSGSYLRI